MVNVCVNKMASQKYALENKKENERVGARKEFLKNLRG